MMMKFNIVGSISPLSPTEGPSLPEYLSFSLKISKLPNLKNVGAILETTAHFSLIAFPEYRGSLTTLVSETTSDPALDVGMSIYQLRYVEYLLR